MKLNNLVTRALSGAVMVAVMVGMILSCRYALALLMMIIALGSLVEFYKFASLAGLKVAKCMGYSSAVILIVLNTLVAFGLLDAKYLVLSILFVLAPFVAQLYRKDEKPLENITASVAGILYCSLAAISMIYLSVIGGGFYPMLVLGYLILVWTNDVGAYLVGISIGRNKLFERHSPKKSWEGFFGGVIFTIALGAYFATLIGESMIFGVGLGFLIAVMGVWGDLIESMFKRAIGIKDSGSIIPGHGGFLDRFDAFLLSAPICLIYFIIFT